MCTMLTKMNWYSIKSLIWIRLHTYTNLARHTPFYMESPLVPLCSTHDVVSFNLTYWVQCNHHPPKKWIDSFHAHLINESLDQYFIKSNSLKNVFEDTIQIKHCTLSDWVPIPECHQLSWGINPIYQTFHKSFTCWR